MEIKRITIDPAVIRVNCYIVSNNTKKAAVIDPGGDPWVVFNYMESYGIIPEFILITHNHSDHIGGITKFKAKFDVPVYGSMRDDFSGITNYVDGGDIIKLGDMNIRVISAPGHSKGSLAYYIPEMKSVFTGDTLFFEDAGWTCFEGGDEDELRETFRGFYALPDDTMVYPGHDVETSIKHEKNFNPFERG